MSAEKPSAEAASLAIRAIEGGLVDEQLWTFFYSSRREEKLTAIDAANALISNLTGVAWSWWSVLYYYYKKAEDETTLDPLIGEVLTRRFRALKGDK